MTQPGADPTQHFHVFTGGTPVSHMSLFYALIPRYLPTLEKAVRASGRVG